MANARDAPTNPVKLFGLTKAMTLPFLELFDWDMPATHVDGTRLALL
jgi:hypothetical protein